MPTLPELKAKAKEMGLKGYSKMKKAELEALIASFTGGAEEEEDEEEEEEEVKRTADVLKELENMLYGQTIVDKAVILGVMFELNRKFGADGRVITTIGEGDIWYNAIKFGGGEVTTERIIGVFRQVKRILNKIKIGDVSIDVSYISSKAHYKIDYDGIAKSDGGDEWGRLLKDFIKSILPEARRTQTELRVIKEDINQEDKDINQEQEQNPPEIDRKLEVATSMYNEEFMRVKMALIQQVSNPEFIDRLTEEMVDIRALYSFTEGMFRDGTKARGDPDDAIRTISRVLFEIFADSKGEYRARNNLYTDRAYEAGIIT